MTATQEKESSLLSNFDLGNLGKGLTGFQKQIVEFQKQAFDSTFDAVVALQDQQEQFLTDLLERSSVVPEEGKQVINEWVETFRRSREDFKAAADKSYDLMEQYFERDEEEESSNEV